MKSENVFPGWPRVGGGVDDLPPENTASDVKALETIDEPTNTDPDPEEETKKDEEKTEEELKALENDDEEEEPEETIEDESTDDETVVSADYPTFKEVSEKYPKLFKDFPNLKDLFAHGFEYRRLYPTIEDAKESASKSEVFDDLESSIMSGDLNPLFDLVKKSDPDSLTKVAEGILPALHAKSTDLYVRTVQPAIVDFIRLMAAEGKTTKNDNQYNAARLAGIFLTGKDFDKDPKVLDSSHMKKEADPELDARKKELDEREQNIATGEFRKFESATIGSTLLTLGKEVSNAIDPDKTRYSEFERKALTKAITDEIGAQLQNDPSHVAKMDSLWKQARKNGFADGYKTRLSLAYLGGARKILPAIKAKAVATKGKVPPSSQGGKKRIPSSGPVRTSGKETDVKSLMKSGKSDRDILGMD